MSESEVIDLMSSSSTIDEWHNNKLTVQKDCPNYLDFWYKSIVISGVMWLTLTKRTK